MKTRSQEKREQDKTLLAAGVVLVAGLIVLGIPPSLLFGL